MSEQQNSRELLWELKSPSQDPMEKETTLQLWIDDRGRFLFLAHASPDEYKTTSPFYIQNSGQMHALIRACISVIHGLVHVMPGMPEGLEDSDEIVVTYFNGHQEQTDAGSVLDWAIIREYMHIESGEIVPLHGSV